MYILTLLPLILVITLIECAVLDPALYLSPNPPLIGTSEEFTPEELWALPMDRRIERDVKDISASSVKNDPIAEMQEESIKPSETFWPVFRNVDYSLGGIHIPLKFSISGIYGGSGPDVSVISSSYGTLTGLTKSVMNSGKTALAGSGYGGYQTRFPSIRIYGGDHRPAWSGWGNGKWGHYGKG